MTLEDLVVAMAAPGQPRVGLAALDAVLAAQIGHRLFTVLVLDVACGMNRRFHSSRPVEYPVGGFKPVQRGSDDHRTLIGPGNGTSAATVRRSSRPFRITRGSWRWAANPA